MAGIPAYAPGESLNAAAVIFRARAPAIGYASYRIEPVDDDTATGRHSPARPLRPIPTERLS